MKLKKKILALSVLSVLVSSHAIGGIIDDIRVGAIDPETGEVNKWQDQPYGTELKSWGIPALNISDITAGPSAPPTYTPVYVIDGKIQPNNELNYDTLNIYDVDKMPSFSALLGMHATHVAGIIGAKQNGKGTVGVNPGNDIINIPIIGASPGDLRKDVVSALDKVLKDSEAKGIFPIVNLSMNSPFFTVVENSGVAEDINVTRALRKLSTRALIIQSSGNGWNHPDPEFNRKDACVVSYDDTQVGDGIIVVGGISANGKQLKPVYIPDYNPDYTTEYSPPQNKDEHKEGGSNGVKCVDVWAPGGQIWSTWSGNKIDSDWSDRTKGILSGTSMAAPHVAALAARFGDDKTTPFQRELYILRNVISTSEEDNHGEPINLASGINWQSVPDLLTPTSVAVNPGSTGNVKSLTDRKFISDKDNKGNDYWNAGSQSGWIASNFARVMNFEAIRINPLKHKGTLVNGNDYPDSSWHAVGKTKFEIYIGNTAATAKLVCQQTKVTRHIESVSLMLSKNDCKEGFTQAQWNALKDTDYRGAYIKVKMTDVEEGGGSSWVAANEMEFYGRTYFGF